MRAVESFFRSIDRAWGAGETVPRVVLRVIGSAALMLQTGYDRGTKDSDVFETTDLTDATKARLIELAGPATTIATAHRMHIDIVPNGLPFMPQLPKTRPVSLNQSLKHLRIEVVDVVDVVVSKLKRFHSDDRSDIDEMVAMSAVPHEQLIERFRAAVDRFSGDARAEDLPRYVANLHRVERDFFGMEELTSVELPTWIDDT